MISRRSMLKTGLLLGGSALAGAALYCGRDLTSEDIATQLSQFLDYPDLAYTLGKNVLQIMPPAQNQDIPQRIDSILARIGKDRKTLPCTRRRSLLDALHASVIADFSEENTVLVEGWLLSHTEAQLCAVLYQLTILQPTGQT